MQQEIAQFDYSTEDNSTIAVRTYKDEDGEVWFVAKDVCDILEIADVTSSLRGLDDDEKIVRSISGGNSGRGHGAKEMNLVNESGLYALIMRSNKPEAKRFRKWVTSEVLPQIRKTGNYSLEKSNKLQLAAPLHEEQPKRSPLFIALAKEGWEIFQKAMRAYTFKEFDEVYELDKMFQQYTGESVLATSGIEIYRSTDDWYIPAPVRFDSYKFREYKEGYCRYYVNIPDIL